ncbi:Nucleoporin AMO1 [Pleurostoma richardsiae]|uniref:Nucleoporin AMO1 n=1 Tax=Pleurostoma richardsiae TaxID=41990 RepID=A0AA38S2A6_9PEZI|nr:Nucleoporin AMO1 [Pleurostoma richardsiae]
MAPVCKFWQQGTCRFGDNCRYEHPGANRSQNANPFSVLGGGGGGGGGGVANRGAASRAGAAEIPYHLSRESILKDLTEERPKWVLSSYGPGRDAPEQLFGGYPREQSFEEIRMHFLSGAASGNPQAAVNEIDALNSNAEQQIQTALSNVDGAMQFVLAAENKHPNRIDICKNNTRPGGTNGEFAVGRRTNAFASPQPSMGQPSNPFQSTPSQPATGGGFGQPSSLGQRPNPFSGGSGGTAAFGQPSQPGGSTAFGQPSQPGAGTAFGQSSQLGGGGGFGQPSALGQRPNPFGTPAFGQPSQPAAPAAQGSGFGQASALGARPSPFGTGIGAAPSPFSSMGSASAATTSAAPNPFAQKAVAAPSPFGQTSAPVNPFAQAQTQENGFSSAPSVEVPMEASLPAPTTTGFGAPSAAPLNPFAQASSAFGQQSGGFGAATQPASTTTATLSNNPYAPGASRQHPPLSSYATSVGGRLQTWKGKSVTYRALKDGEHAIPGIQNFDGTFDRIWFPDGPPPYYKDTEPAAASQSYSEADKAAWEKFMQAGKFELGGMPEAPPLREFCAWDI